MRLDLGPLREIPVATLALTVYVRHVVRPGNGEAPDPLRVGPQTGRWPSEWTLYTATTPAVAWAEYCRNHPDDVADADITGGLGLDHAAIERMGTLPLPVVARSYFKLDFEFTAFADLTSEWARALLVRARFDLACLTADAPCARDCAALAGLADELGWQAIRVPSAAWPRPPEACVPVFASGRVGLVDQRMVVEAARPTVAVAAATRYVAGQRPAWLG